MRSSSRSVIPISSAPVSNTSTGFLPVGAVVRWFRGENPNGPEYQVTVTISSFGTSVVSKTFILIARNGLTTMHPILNSIVANTAVAPTAPGEISIELSTVSDQQVDVYYL